MKQVKWAVIIFCIPLLLTGCMYPDSQLKENQTPYKEQIQSVQSAVDQFQTNGGGILPIITKEAETPIYQKYVVDFKKIVPRYIAEAPPNSFDAGGIFQYVLIDVETDPVVKLLDVRMAQAIQDLNLRLTSYRQANGYPPYGEVLSDEVFTLDYKKLGLNEAPTVTSPYSQRPLSIIVNNKAELFVDYTPDLYDALKEKKHTFKKGEDIRGILVEESDFVPAFSLPYTIDESEKPIFLVK